MSNKIIIEYDGLKIGDIVFEKYTKNYGVIVKIVKWEGDLTSENHGTVYVWQLNQTNYGGDNCQHYCLYNWRNSLEVVDTLKAEEIYDTITYKKLKLPNRK